MKSLFIKKSAYVGSYIIIALIMEFITFNATNLGSFPEYFWLDLAALLMLSTIIFILPSFTLQAVLIIILLSIQVLLGFINQSLIKYSGTVFTIDMIDLGNEVGGAYNPSFVNYMVLFALVCMLFIEFAVLLILRRYRVKQSFKMGTVTTLLIIFCLMQISTTSVYNQTIESFASSKVDDEYYILDDTSYLYDTFVIKQKAFKKFGTFAFYYKNINNVFDEYKQQTEEEKQAETEENLIKLNNYFSRGAVNEDTKYSGVLKGSNLITVMIESGEWYGINEKFTPTLYALANQGVSATQYYSRNKTNHSEAIGGIFGTYPTKSMFMDNLFYKDRLIDNNFDFTMPNIFQNSGYTTSFLHPNFEEFYGRNQTHKIFGFENTYFLEEMEGLKGSGLMEGHDKKIVFDDWDLDELAFSTNLDRLVPTDSDSPFFSFLTTVTMHGGYDDLMLYGNYPYTDASETTLMTDAEKQQFSENCLVKDLEKFYNQITKEDFFAIMDEMGVTETFTEFNYTAEQINEFYLRYKRYQAGYMSLDRGLEALVQDLIAKGEFDNTAIVMYADHSAYFNQQNYYLKGVEEFEYQNPAVYKVPFYLYHGSMGFNTFIHDDTTDEETQNLVVAANNPKLESEQITKFTCTFDIVPTILDLFGYKYNENLYHGTSIFSDEESIFFSMESGIFTDKFYSMDAENLLYGVNESQEDKTEFINKTVEYLNKQEMFERMYKYDFFNTDNYEDYAFSDITKMVYLADS